jgi:hypothetical protein
MMMMTNNNNNNNNNNDALVVVRYTVDEGYDKRKKKNLVFCSCLLPNQETIMYTVISSVILANTVVPRFASIILSGNVLVIQSISKRIF